MKISFITKPDGLYPVTPWDKEKYSTVKKGMQTVLDIKTKRNVKLFRKWWALCRMIADNSERFRDEKHVSDALLIVTGYRDEMYLPNGTMYLKPHHINWESCSGEKFEKIWAAAMPWARESLGCTQEEIDDNLIWNM